MNAGYCDHEHLIPFGYNATHPSDGVWPFGCGLNSSPRPTGLGCGRLDHPDAPSHHRLGASPAKYPG